MYISNLQDYATPTSSKTLQHVIITCFFFLPAYILFFGIKINFIIMKLSIKNMNQQPHYILHFGITTDIHHEIKVTKHINE